jgi:hypothetical protein
LGVNSSVPTTMVFPGTEKNTPSDVDERRG